MQPWQDLTEACLLCQFSIFRMEGSNQLLSYATAAADFSTWDGEDYFHVDTLYLSVAVRSHGLGTQLMAIIDDKEKQLRFRRIE